MTGDESAKKLADLRRAAQQGDAQAMFELGTLAEERARQLMANAREAFRRGAEAGSLDAEHALVRLAAADGDYEEACWRLQDAERRHPDAPAHRHVSVAPDVLGPRLALDGDGADEFAGAGTFTVISPYPSRAAAALTRVAPGLMEVDEHGKVLSWEEREREQEQGSDWDIPYTPNFVFDAQWCQYAAMIQLDTKGGMWAAMGRTMVGMIVEALVADAIPAHVVGHCPALQTYWTVWEEPAGA